MKRTNAWAVAVTVGVTALAIGSAIAVNTKMFASAVKPPAVTAVAAANDLTIHAAVDTTVPTVPATIVRYDDVYIFETASEPKVPVASGPALTVPDLAVATEAATQPVKQPQVLDEPMVTDKSASPSKATVAEERPSAQGPVARSVVADEKNSEFNHESEEGEGDDEDDAGNDD